MMKIISKKCGACGAQVPLALQAGDKCPYCGVCWAFEKDRTVEFAFAWPPAWAFACTLGGWGVFALLLWTAGGFLHPITRIVVCCLYLAFAVPMGLAEAREEKGYFCVFYIVWGWLAGAGIAAIWDPSLLDPILSKWPFVQVIGTVVWSVLSGLLLGAVVLVGGLVVDACRSLAKRH
jgi:hypothetical protein